MDNFLGLFFGSMFIAAAIVAVLAIVCYILISIALYRMASNRDIEYAWLAFIPLGNAYIQGMVIEDFNIFNFTVPNAQYVLPMLPVVSYVLSSIGIPQTVAALVVFIISLFALYELFMILDEDTAKRNIILSAVIPITAPFILFSLRDN